MAFAGINYWAILIAAVAGWIVGGIWYGVLGKPWLAALGKTKAEIKPQQGTPAFYLPFVYIKLWSCHVLSLFALT